MTHPADVAPQWTITPTHAVPAVEVAPGVRRRSMPSCPYLDVWIIEFDPGTQWPEIDHHENFEEVYVIDGEFLDQGRTYRGGSFLHFEPGTSHQPRTHTGGRMFGYNLRPPSMPNS